MTRPRSSGARVALAVEVLAGLLLLLVAAGCSARASSGGGVAPPPPSPPPVVTLSATAPISPTTPVVVDAAGGRLTSVVMTGPGGKKISGDPTPDGARWTTSTPLSYGETYTVVADAVSPRGTPTHQQSAVHTVSPRTTEDISVVPGASDVGVGQPISVRFPSGVQDKDAAEKGLQIATSPPQPGAWHWISASQVDYRPQSYWKPGTTVTLSSHLFGVDLGGGGWGGEDVDKHVTHIHDAWVAKADGASKQMQILDNGAVVKTMNISLGGPKFPTHTGTHVISDKQPSVVMDSATFGVLPGQPGYYKETVLLDERISNDGEFVHAAPWSVGQQGNANVSNGCVNLSPADAQWFYDHFGIGDVVEVTNSGGPPLPIYDTWGDWALSWDKWSSD